MSNADHTNPQIQPSSGIEGNIRFRIITANQVLTAEPRLTLAVAGSQLVGLGVGMDTPAFGWAISHRSIVECRARCLGEGCRTGYSPAHGTLRLKRIDCVHIPGDEWAAKRAANFVADPLL